MMNRFNGQIAPSTNRQEFICRYLYCKEQIKIVRDVRNIPYNILGVKDARR